MASGNNKTGDSPKPRRKKSAKRSAKCEVARVTPPVDPGQLRQTVAWFVGGASDYEVREAIREAYPGQDPQPLIEAAYHEFAAHSLRPQLPDEKPTVQDVIHGWAFLATRDLYRKMVDIGDFTGALTAVKRIDDMVKR